MRCTTCDYELWNLTSRTCPECGTGFKPSQFSFEPDSVRFICPHCQQEYYGTDAQGHLSPRAFDCVKCAVRIDMDEMVLLPAAGVSEHDTRPDEVPWLEAKGKWRGLRTIGWAMFQPMRLAKALPHEPRPGRAIFFATLANTVFLLLGAGFFIALAFFSAIAGAAAGGGGASVMGILAGIIGALLGALVIVPLAFAFVLLLWSFATHGLLCLFAKPVGGHARTLECLSYASGAHTLAAVPCIGVYASVITWVWWAVSATIMLTHAQRVRGWAAAVATILPPLIVAGTVITLAVLTIVGIVRQGTAMSQKMQQSQQLIDGVDATDRTGELGDALVLHARDRAGAIAETPLELVALGTLKPEMLIPTDENGVRDEESPAGQWLARLAAADDGEAAEMIAQATAQLPPSAPCIRVGDFIFIRDAANAPGEAAFTDELWVMVCLPKVYLPALGRLDAPSTTSSDDTAKDKIVDSIDDVLLDIESRARAGRAESFSLFELRLKLANQNSVRTSAGLPELPDLTPVPEVVLPPP